MAVVQPVGKGVERGVVEVEDHVVVEFVVDMWQYLGHGKVVHDDFSRPGGIVAQ